MKSIFLIVFMLCGTFTQAQQILVRNLTPVDYNTIAYPNLAGNTTSSQPAMWMAIYSEWLMVGSG